MPQKVATTFASILVMRRADEPPPNEWTPLVGSESSEVSNAGTLTSIFYRGLQAPARGTLSGQNRRLSWRSQVTPLQMREASKESSSNRLHRASRAMRDSPTLAGSKNLHYSLRAAIERGTNVRYRLV